jgi:hypothetical protein
MWRTAMVLFAGTAWWDDPPRVDFGKRFEYNSPTLKHRALCALHVRLGQRS